MGINNARRSEEAAAEQLQATAGSAKGCGLSTSVIIVAILDYDNLRLGLDDHRLVIVWLRPAIALNCHHLLNVRRVISSTVVQFDHI